MIVDDHEVVRMGLKAALEIEHDFTVVAEAGNGQEAIDSARVTPPGHRPHGRADGRYGRHRGVPRDPQRVPRTRAC